MAICDRSWYLRVLEDQVQKAVSKKQAGGAFRDIVEFEQMLADDGTVIVKFWLHINKKEQKKRFQALEKDPLESWRVTKEDWARHKKYNNYLKAAEEMLARTESEWGPWTIVEATSRWYARRKIFETVIRALEAKMGSAAPLVRPYVDKDEAARAASGAGRKRRVLKGA